MVHFEQSALGEQLALAAYAGLNGTTCHMKNEEELSTLVLTRCMPKSKGKGRGSAKGQGQQAQQQAQQQASNGQLHPGLAPMYGGNGMPPAPPPPASPPTLSQCQETLLTTPTRCTTSILS